MSEFSYKKIIDISLPLSEDTIVYPGNPKIELEPEKGETTTRTKIHFGSHTGTHVDAPLHAFFTEENKGEPLGGYSLETLVGPARVLDFSGVEKEITVDDLKDQNVQKGERLLFKTKNSDFGFEIFKEDYIYLSGDGADYLKDLKVALVGIDSLSIKERGSSDIRPHTSLLEAKIPIFEGLNLKDISAGEYFFIGLPLRFDTLDGAPARAVLLQ